jgi:cyclopropane fatty-acyl-phospholipid synthase-like methyltransferase
MVLSLARTLEPGARVLDVGAGHGRNSLPMCKLGLWVDALELVESLCDEMRAARAHAALELSVIRGDLLDPQLELATDRYDLIVLSEVVSHFRELADLERTLEKLTVSLAPDGLLAMNVFISEDGYTPEALVRQAAQVALSSSFTRTELETVTSRLPLKLMTDEPALAYERQHLPAEFWPPTPWFEGWSEGRNIFDLPGQTTPIRLHWLVYKKAR